jgi:hypothetical protein
VLDLRGPLDDAQQRVIAAGADWHFARLVPFGDDGRPGVTPNPAFVAAGRPWPTVRRGPGAGDPAHR